jgi:signal transduction histidine kinase
MELSVTSPAWLTRWRKPRSGLERFGLAQTIVLLAALSLLALAASLYWTPPHYIAAGLYAVPTLVAAHRLAPYQVGVVAALSLLLDVASAMLDAIPAEAWVFNALALLVVGYLGVATASERDRAASRTREAEDVQARLQRFMAMVGHDMRTPLFTVLARAQLLTDLSVEADRANALAIEDAARRMQRFADDLDDASRVGSDSFAMSPSHMDLAAVLRRLVDGAAATSAEHTLLLDAPERLEGCWDPGRIEQLFENLLSNAIKYSPQGGQVCVRASLAEGHADVEVEDHGIGIAAEDAGRLFEPFARLADPAAKGAKGAGLGLFIANGIAIAHGGSIQLSSAPGRGSTFHVTLPR